MGNSDVSLVPMPKHKHKEDFTEFLLVKEPGLRPKLTEESMGSILRMGLKDGDFLIVRLYDPTPKRIASIDRFFSKFMEQNKIQLKIVLAGIDFEIEHIQKEKAIEILNNC